GRLRDSFRRGFKDLLTIGALLDMSLQAREGGLADGLGADQSEGRFRWATRHGRGCLVSVFELISSARRRSPSLASRSNTRLWAVCAARYVMFRASAVSRVVQPSMAICQNTCQDWSWTFSRTA